MKEIQNITYNKEIPGEITDKHSALSKKELFSENDLEQHLWNYITEPSDYTVQVQRIKTLKKIVTSANQDLQQYIDYAGNSFRASLLVGKIRPLLALMLEKLEREFPLKLLEHRGRLQVAQEGSSNRIETALLRNTMPTLFLFRVP